MTKFKVEINKAFIVTLFVLTVISVLIGIVNICLTARVIYAETPETDVYTYRYETTTAETTAETTEEPTEPTTETPVTQVTKVTKVTEFSPVGEITVSATAYCPCRECCGAYADNRPNGVVYTASGAIARANHTIAVDPSVIPLGTVLEINGNLYVAEDTGSAVKGNIIDIYFDNHEDALNFGRQTLTVRIVESEG